MSSFLPINRNIDFLLPPSVDEWRVRLCPKMTLSQSIWAQISRSNGWLSPTGC